MVIFGTISYRQAKHRDEFVFSVGLGAGDLLRNELLWLREECYQVYIFVRPVIAHVLMRTGEFLYRSGFELYGKFTRNIFGRIDVKEAKNTSFFVKHIREFKDELAREDKI